MTSEFVIDILELCTKHGYLPPTIVRNFKIQQEYKDLRENGITGKEAREKLSEQYCVGIKNIEFILYGKSKKMNQTDVSNG